MISLPRNGEISVLPYQRRLRKKSDALARAAKEYRRAREAPLTAELSGTAGALLSAVSAHRGTGSSNPVPSSGESANFRSLSRWRDAPAPRLSAACNRPSITDCRARRLSLSVLCSSDPLGREITHVSNR
jgi:hypothetical protein